MNVAEVEHLARTFSSVARSLARRQLDIERLVGSTSWSGPVATRFRQVWPQHRAFLTRVSSELESMATAARANADEQRRASAEGDGVGAAVSPSAMSPALASILALPLDQQASRWVALTPTERAELIRANAAWMGADRAVAPEIRYEANRLLIREEFERLSNRPGSASDVQRMWLYGSLLNRNAQVLAFDASGDGRIAVVTGDLTAADHVAVCVPGISTNLDTVSVMIGEGQRLHAATRNTAVVSWLGYDAPVGIGLNPFRMRSEITTQRMADAGADALVGFVDSVRTMNRGADLTVIGHSYGSLVTGLAATRGLDADNVVFVGSPGVGVDSVRDLRLAPDTRVFAVAPSHAIRLGPIGIGGDAVSNLGHNVRPFGRPPTDPGFGATVLDIGARANVIGSHSDYYDQGSVSLRRLASVVQGDKGRL